jgi:hypothetical protein
MHCIGTPPGGDDHVTNRLHSEPAKPNLRVDRPCLQARRDSGVPLRRRAP